MNLLFIVHGLYPCNVGGTEIFNYYFIKQLTKRHSVYVLTCCEEEINLDAVIIRINRKKFGCARISIPLLSFFNILKLRNKIDLIHLPYMSPDWPAWIPVLLAKKILNIPYIISIRGGGMRKWIPEFPYKYFFRHAAGIIGVSSRLKEEYQKRTGKDVKYIPSGLPFERSGNSSETLREKYGFGVSDYIIICIGSLKKIKGSDLLLNAFVKLKDDFVQKHNLKLVFAGDGDMRSELEEKAENMGFDEHVTFLGNISREEIPGIYKMSDLYVIPSQFEGMSNALLEAMFNELPIIGNDTSGISNMIQNGENGLLFEFNDPDDLKDKMIYIIENESIAKKIAEGAKRTYDSDYDYKNVIERYEELYEEAGRTR